MSQWIILVVIAQFINAFVAIIDKYLVSSKRVGEPVVYAFYVSILSALSIIIFAFIHLISSFELIISNMIN